MTTRSILAGALLAILFTGPARADDPCNAACTALMQQGQLAHSQGKLQEALAKYLAAHQAAPAASVPVSAASQAYLAAAGANPAKAGQLRAEARRLAKAALGLAADDPVAQETLRMLESDAPSPLYVPNAPAARAIAAAEQLFVQRRYAEALPRFEEAMRLDPKASYAWIGAGDCWYMQKDWDKAAALFRRAVEIEPRNAQGWRFLADTLEAQGKGAEAERALLDGIAADPGQLPTWGKLAALRRNTALPLKSLHLRRGVRVEVGADGKSTLNVDGDLQKTAGAADNAMRLALGVAEANARADKNKTYSPYEIELQAWRAALKVMDETAAAGQAPVSDPALAQMIAFGKDGQLEPAILLLAYRESYRPALEAWLQADPDGVRRFVDRYGMQP